MTTDGTIDCDIHPGRAGHQGVAALHERLLARVIRCARHRWLRHDELSAERADHLPAGLARAGRTAGLQPANMQRDALDAFGISLAICNPLTGGQVAVSESMGAAICSAVNDWIIEHWLDREPRLRASIVVPAQAPLLAVEEIERRAADQRFVQVLLPVACEMMLGRSYYWPIYEAAVAARPADRHPRRQHVSLRTDVRVAGRRTICTTTSRTRRFSRISCSA